MRTTLCVATLAIATLVANGAILNYDSNDINAGGTAASMPVQSHAAGISVSDMTRGPAFGGSGGHSLDAFGAHFRGDETTTLAEAVSDGNYFSWTVTPDAGFSVSYDSVDFWHFLPERESGDAVFSSTVISLLTSATGFAEGDLLDQIDLNVQLGDGSNFGPLSFDVSGVAALQAASAPVEFRLYMHDLYAIGQTVAGRPNFWENRAIGTDDGEPGASNALSMEGTVIPEPLSASLLLLGAAAIRSRRRG
jgi:hypothetical protein